MHLLKVKRWSRNSTWIFILLVLLYAVQHAVNFLSYDLRGPSQYLVKTISGIGLEEEFVRFALWDFFQICITLLCLKVFFKKPLHEMGFNLQNPKQATKYILHFVWVYPLLVAGLWLVIYNLAGADALVGGTREPSAAYMIKDVLMYGLLPGLGEEPLFRVLVIQFLLSTVFKEKDLSDRNTRLGIILISALCFAYGHIYIVSWVPFEITYTATQLLAAFGLGIFYAVTYIRTKSILAAVICHNYSDFIYRLGYYLCYYLFIK